MAALIRAVEKAGYGAAEVQPQAVPAEPRGGSDRRDLLHLMAAAVLAAPLAAGMAIPALMLPGWTQFALASVVQFWLGARFYRASWHAAFAP